MEVNKDIQKSILRYPGGKSKALKFILEHIPNTTTHLVAPFFGGGSVELACASMGIKVSGYDIFQPLVIFWQCVLEDKLKLANIVKTYRPLSKERFYELQKQVEFKDKWEQAAVFFVLNRSSFSGSTLSGGMSPNHPRFNEGSIERLENFEINQLSVKCLDFAKAIANHPQELLYCDPPYLIKDTLYGKKGDTHKNFDHQALAEILKSRDNWILSYNDCPEIRELYKDYTILTPQWKYGMGNDKNSREVLILSKNLSK